MCDITFLVNISLFVSNWLHHFKMYDITFPVNSILFITGLHNCKMSAITIVVNTIYLYQTFYIILQCSILV